MLENEQKSGSTDQFLKTILSPGFEWAITVAKIVHIVMVHSPKADRFVCFKFCLLDNSGKTQSVSVRKLKFTKMQACQKDKSIYILFIHIIY